MNTLVIYESAYGNTAKIAQTIADTLHTKAHLSKDVSADDVQNADFVIIGSPTQGGLPLPSIKTFIDGLPVDALKGKKVAAFDTRIASDEQNLFLKWLTKTIGYAAEKIEQQLARKGASVAIAPEAFIVTGKEGPLKSGELERAKRWAATATK